MSEPVITVVRLAYDAARDNPPRAVINAVANVDLALAAWLHDDSHAARPYATAVRADGRALDVVCFDDRVAQALKTGGRDARIVTRRTFDGWLAEPSQPYLRLAFLSPTHFRIAGRDDLLPTAASVFGGLLRRWRALDLPALPYANLDRVPARLHGYRLTRAVIKTVGVGAFTGCCEYDLVPIGLDGAAVVWALARFAEWRGVGAHTSYGLGRVRLVQPGDQAATLGHVWERAG